MAATFHLVLTISLQSFAYREQLQAQEAAIDLQYQRCATAYVSFPSRFTLTCDLVPVMITQIRFRCASSCHRPVSLPCTLALCPCRRRWSSAPAPRTAAPPQPSAACSANPSFRYEAMLSAFSRLDGERPSGVDDSLSFLDLQSKSYDERVEALMAQTVCLPMDRLFLLCGASTEALRQRVLAHVQHGSVYIRGCWVRKSEFRVPCTTIMISIATNCLRWLRNIMLISLYNHGYVLSSDIKAEIDGIGSVGHSIKWSFVQDMLKEVCVCGSDRRWRLKYEHMPGYAAAVAAAESAYGSIIAVQREYITECAAIVAKQRELFRGSQSSEMRAAAGGAAACAPSVHVAEPQLCQLITQVLQQPCPIPRCPSIRRTMFEKRTCFWLLFHAPVSAFGVSARTHDIPAGRLQK
jgi:hypothetical protein